jgi:hypothetical protein
MADEYFKTVASLIGISVMAAGTRVILSADKRTFRDFLRGSVLAIFAGGVVGALIWDTTLSPAFKGGVTAAVGFVADYLLMFLLSFVQALRDNPDKIIDRLLALLPSRLSTTIQGVRENHENNAGKDGTE